MPDLEAREDAGKARQLRTMPYCPVKCIRRNDGSRRFEAHIIGDIKDVDDYIDLIDSLLTAEETDEYHIYIDSPGGYVSAGSIIASAIEHTKAQVYTHAVGLCASAACLIHNAAPEGHALVEDFGILMIHMSMHCDTGVSSQIANRASDQVRYVLENLLRKAKNMGYIYEDELEKIQTGENIYISAIDFARRVEAHRRGERANDDSDVPHDMVPMSATESFELAYDSIMGERCKLHFPNVSRMSYEEYERTISDIDTTLTTHFPDMMPLPMPGVMDPIAKLRLLKANTLYIRTRDNIDFRVYIPSDLMFSRVFVTNLCLFLDSLKEHQTVNFILGAKIIDMVACNLGAVISAMRRCKATIRTIAAGYCSIPESILWTYGEERKVLSCGALTFGKTEVVRIVKKYDDYFAAAFRRALEVQIITDADIKELNQFKTKLILRQDLPEDQF